MPRENKFCTTQHEIMLFEDFQIILITQIKEKKWWILKQNI